MYLETIEIKNAKKINKTDFQFDTTILDLYNSNTVADLLSNQSSLYLKSYGSGSSATLSLRGGSANQALVKWNNIPISNPMLGVSDISLMPIALFDNVRIDLGGETINEGSGAMTGVIRLDQNQAFAKGFNGKLNTNISSFGHRSISGGVTYSNTKLSSSTKAVYTQSVNDFHYQINPTLDKKKQTHAALNTKAIAQYLSYRFDNNASLNFNVWLQKTFREIPPTTVQNRSEAEQDDMLKRFALNYTAKLKKLRLSTDLAYLDEDNNYLDPLTLIDTKNNFQRWVHQSELEYGVQKNLNIKLLYQISSTKANTEFYEKVQTLNQNSIGLSIDKSFGKLGDATKFTIAARKEWNQNTSSSISPLFQFDTRLSPHLFLTAKLSKEFRFPTTNELFWRPGGNTELLPEEGYNQELDLKYLTQNETRISFYHRLINNWILWGVKEGTLFYSANNLARVRSYGFEFHKSFKIITGNIKHAFDASYAYSLSKNLVTLTNPIIESGSQLFYTPKHSWQVNWIGQLKTYQCHINSNYTSSVNGINEDLDGFMIVNAAIGKKIKFKETNTQLRIGLRNIFNVSYRVIERRPMPGRNYTLDLNLNF